MRELVAEHIEWHSALQAYRDNGTDHELNAMGHAISGFAMERHPGLFQRINLDVAEEDFSTFGLEDDFAAGGERVGSFVGQLAVHVLPHVPVAVHKFDHIPLSVRFFQLIGRVAKAGHAFDFALIEAVDPGRFAFGPGDACAGLSVWTNTSQRCAIGHPEIARAAFVDLKLDRARPHLIGTLNVVENAAVARLAVPRSKGSLAPFEFGAQIVILVLLFSDEVTELSSGDMDNAILHSEDMVGIGVQAIAAQDCVELIQILAVEEKDGWAVRRNVLGLPVGNCRAYAKKKDEAADLQMNTHGEWRS